jgi:hypothetical protein
MNSFYPRLNEFLNEDIEPNDIFVRFGGLSKVKYKKKKFSEMNQFHIPPVSHGVFAFPIKAIETFLFAWKKNWQLQEKKFKYRGNIWHHLEHQCKQSEIIDKKGTWVLTSFKTWEKAFSKESLNLRHGNKEYGGTKNINEPYAAGVSGIFSKDHLEIFISDKI